MRLGILWLLLLLLNTAQALPAEDLASRPEMSPERCAELPPTELYERLTSAEHRVPEVSTSLGGQDYFCTVYQQQLQKYVDQHYPRAREYRKPLTEAFMSMVDFVEEIYSHSMIKHLRERTSAQVEWFILQAEKDNYVPWRETNYNVRDIERLGLIMLDGNSRGNALKEAKALPRLHEAIRHFLAATTLEDAPQQRQTCFAHRLIKFMADLI